MGYTIISSSVGTYMGTSKNIKQEFEFYIGKYTSININSLQKQHTYGGICAIQDSDDSDDDQEPLPIYTKIVPKTINKMSFYPRYHEDAGISPKYLFKRMMSDDSYDMRSDPNFFQGWIADIIASIYDDKDANILDCLSPEKKNKISLGFNSMDIPAKNRLNFGKRVEDVIVKALNIKTRGSKSKGNVSGMCDGTGYEYLFEIKSTQKKVPDVLDIVFRAQVQLYLHLYNMDKAYVIQVNQKDFRDNKVHTIHKSDQEIDFLINIANKFHKNLEDFSKESSNWGSYFNSIDREHFIRNQF